MCSLRNPVWTLISSALDLQVTLETTGIFRMLSHVNTLCFILRQGFKQSRMALNFLFNWGWPWTSDQMVSPVLPHLVFAVLGIKPQASCLAKQALHAYNTSPSQLKDICSPLAPNSCAKSWQVWVSSLRFCAPRAYLWLIFISFVCGLTVYGMFFSRLLLS